jgi:hypothetical protein
MSIPLPILTLQPPSAGWWPITVHWQSVEYTDWASCVARDPFIDLIVWFEAILLGQLPAVWYNNGEEVQWPILAEAMGPNQIHLTIHPRADAGYKYTLAEKDSYPVLMSGSVDARAYVASWYRIFREHLANQDFAPEEWDADLRLLDYSRIEALLAEESAPDAWQEDYVDDQARSSRSVLLIRQIFARMAAGIVPQAQRTSINDETAREVR